LEHKRLQREREFELRCRQEQRAEQAKESEAKVTTEVQTEPDHMSFFNEWLLIKERARLEQEAKEQDRQRELREAKEREEKERKEKEEMERKRRKKEKEKQRRRRARERRARRSSKESLRIPLPPIPPMPPKSPPKPASPRVTAPAMPFMFPPFPLPPMPKKEEPKVIYIEREAQPVLTESTIQVKPKKKKHRKPKLLPKPVKPGAPPRPPMISALPRILPLPDFKREEDSKEEDTGMCSKWVMWAWVAILSLALVGLVIYLALPKSNGTSQSPANQTAPVQSNYHAQDTPIERLSQSLAPENLNYNYQQ